MQRRGKWIWRDRGMPLNPPSGTDAKLDANLFVHFRRTFSLDALPSSAPARISADGRYRLYVNGAYLGRGPARCEPLLQYYDMHDLAPHLRVGENVVAVIVHSYGRDMAWYELPRTQWSRAFGCGGLFFECDEIAGIDSDASWRYAVSPAWQQDTPPGAVGFVEIYDAQKEIGAWTELDFDDSGWAQALPLTAPAFRKQHELEPFPVLVERDIPHMLEEQRDAVRVLNVRQLALDATRDLVALAEATPEQLTSCTVLSADAALKGSGACELQLAPNSAVTFVVDFGRDVSGYPRVDIEGPAGTALDLSYSERLRDDGRCPVQRSDQVSSQNVHRYVLREGRQSWEKFERAGFRYLQLTVSPPPGAPSATVRLHRANVNFTSYPVAERGAFTCSDDALTRIWRAGQYTLQLCMQDGFEDCPSREQRQWVGDAYVEALANYAAFGDTKLTAKLIRQVAQSQMRDGMTQMATPSDMSARWPVYIVDYCLSWIATAREYVLHTGDAAILEDVFPSIARAVAWFERHIGTDGLLVDPPGWIFIDWAEVDRRGACTVLNALLVQTLGHAAELAEHEGAAHLAGRWRALAERIGNALNSRLWDESRGVYVDALLPGGPGRRVSQHANAALISAGIAPAERWDRVLDYIMDQERLVVTSTTFSEEAPIDEERQVVLAQPFFMHWVHRALVAAGRFEQLLDNIRARWLPMLSEDGTETLWEHWHGRESRCHAWSATPTYDLSREVLGVRPILPGFDKFVIQPSPAGLSWAEGRYPSVKGDIPISWRCDRGLFRLEFETPEQAEAEVVLPPKAHSPRVNGIAVRAGPNSSGVLTVPGLGPGRWTVEATMED